MEIYTGDCRTTLRKLIRKGRRVDAIVTDPPHGYPTSRSTRPVGCAKGTLFWDDDVADDPETWRPAFEILKPGGHLVAIVSPLTGHRTITAIAAAGFEIRDKCVWLYATGRLKSRDIGRDVAAKYGTSDWDGWGTRLKPAHEEIVLARKPLAASSVAANVVQFGTGALNIDACRHDGRFPANVIHDGSDEVMAMFSETRSGNASRYFFCAKPRPDEKCLSRHPTIKPVELMKHLMRLVTQPGGVVLDMFAGSGPTGQAALELGMSPILIEKEAKYIRAEAAVVEKLPLPTEIDQCPQRPEPHDRLHLLLPPASCSPPHPCPS